jgi:hypothetical protein
MDTTAAPLEALGKRTFGLVALALAVALAAAAPVAGCSDVGGTCHYPVGVETEPDGSAGFGCFAAPPGRLCAVSNGATVLADGGVKGGTESCQSICSGSDYQLTCTGMPTPGATVPSPDSSLGCSVVPLSTPSNTTIYCCPCD